jgi:hypothetical protein
MGSEYQYGGVGDIVSQRNVLLLFDCTLGEDKHRCSSITRPLHLLIIFRK